MQEELKEENIENIENKEEVEVNELEKVKNELEEYKKAYAIKMADFQNFSKRKEKELQEYKEYASRNIILKVLENLDNLERAVSVATEHDNKENLIEGINMSINNFNEMLKHEGVEEIPTENEIYNAELHHAIATVNESDKENNTIVNVFQKGYKLKGRVIRPSMVVINKIEEKKQEEE